VSDRPVAERLQIKGERRLAVIGASPALEKTVGAGKARADVAKADVVLLFTPDRAALDKSLPKLLRTMPPSAILWIAYPKLSSKIAGDLSRDTIAGLAPEHGLDTVSQIAIDEDWSALRLKRAK
jgi:hypothetical protein